MKFIMSILIFVIVPTAWAQNVPTLSVNVNVVSLLATVHDHDGRVVSNRTQGDFVLAEDGISQKTRYFSRDSDFPLTVGIMVDTSRSQTGVLGEESKASETFLTQVLGEGKDQAFIAHFDTRVEILQGLTSSRSDLASALYQLAIPEDVSTLLYSAVQESSSKVMNKQPGRKAIILLTDGVAYKDPASIESAIEAAQRADTVIYSIRFSDPVEAYRPIRGRAACSRERSWQGGAAANGQGNRRSFLRGLEESVDRRHLCRDPEFTSKSIQYRLRTAANVSRWKVP
jgi:VWFA-related protein